MKKTLIGIAFLGIGFFACTPTDTTNNDPALSGKWRVELFDGGKASSFNATFVVDAKAQTIEGSSGCNLFNAQNAQIDTVAKTLTLPVVITTKIACTDVLSDFETNYYAALKICDSYGFENDKLLLKEKGKTRITLGK